MRVPATELLKSIPEFIGIRVNEEPRFEVVEALRDFEVRGYDPIRLVKTSVPGDFETFRKVAFDRLAGYIFGDNATGEKIAMTSPVCLAAGKKGWTMMFALPHRFLLEPAPRPKHSGVKLELAPSRTVAVYTYSGTNKEERTQDAAAKLEAWLAKHPTYVAASPVWFAEYDAPFVVPFFKKNEAMVQVHRKQ